MIEWILTRIFRWNRPDFVGSRRWWVMCVLFTSVCSWMLFECTSEVVDGLLTSNVKIFCARGCRRLLGFQDTYVSEQADATTYWIHIGIWSFGAISFLTLILMCLWLWLNRRKI